MKREKEFKKFLSDNFAASTAKHYYDYCTYIEELVKMDMDDIALDCRNIDIANKSIEDNYALKSIKEIKNGFNAYLKFAFEQGMLAKSVTSSMKIDSFAGAIVEYYSDVPVRERDESLRRALEDEYPKILLFAKNVFGVNYGYIPVYLSKEAPPARIYPVSEKFIDKLRQKLQEQRAVSDKERGLISKIIERKGYQTSVLARFFSDEKPFIEIYYKNVQCEANALEMAINSLAHEYMHFIEYVYTAKNFAAAFGDHRVSEALADFFGFLYSIKRGGKLDLEVAEDRYVAWKVLDGSGWPYAYALYFMKKRIKDFSPIFADYKDEGCINKLVEVFNATPNVADAYNKLIKL